MYAFWQWAHAILAGDWLGRDTYHPDHEWRTLIAPIETWYRWWGGKTIYHQAPLYPYFLAGLLMVKDSLEWVIAVQLLLGTMQIVILFSLARQLLDERAALLAAAIAAWYGPFVFHEGVLLRDWLPPLLEPLILLLVVRAKNSSGATRWVLAGVAMALAVLTKETTLAVSGIAVLWMVRELRRDRLPVLRPLSLVIAAFMVCLLPLLIRNVLVGAPALAISVQGPGSIIGGLAADSIPVGYDPLASSPAAVREEAGPSMLRAFRAALRAHQGDLPGLLHHQFYKVRGLVDPFEVPNNVSYAYGQQISPVLKLMIGYGVVFPLGVAGFFFLWRRWPKAGVLYWYLSATLGIQFATFILSRFRLAFVPILILSGAALLVQVWDAIRESRPREATAVFSVVCAIVLAQQLWAPFGNRADSAQALDHLTAASVYVTEHRSDRALEEIAQFRKIGGNAVEADSSHVAIAMARITGDAHLQWAFDLFEQNRTEEGRTHVELAEQGYAVLPATSIVSYNLGLAYLRLKERDLARSHFVKFLQEESTGPRAQHVADLLRLLEADKSDKSGD